MIFKTKFQSLIRLCLSIIHIDRVIGFYFVGIVLILASCDHQKHLEHAGLKSEIDSLNTEFGKDLTYDSLKLAEISRLIEVSDSINYPAGKINLAITAARIYYFNFQNQEALEMLNIANKAMLKTGDKRLEALVNLYFGFFNIWISNLDVALEFYLKAMQLSLEAEDSTIYAKSLTSIGSLYMESDYLDKASEYFGQSIAINKMIHDDENLSIDYHRMGLNYLKKGEMDSARFYLETELKMSKSSQNTLLYIYNLNNMASFQIRSGMFDLGEQYSLEALRLMDSIIPYISPTSAKSVIHANLGLVYQNKGDYQNALHHFDLAYADSLYNIDPNYRLDLLFQLYQTHKYLKNSEKADFFLDKYFKQRDFVDNEKAKQNLLDMEMRYNFNQIQNENEQKQYRIRLLFYSISVVLILGILTLVMFLQKQRIKINNVKLNRDIQHLNMEKLNRELASQALNIVRINERNTKLIKTLKNKLPNFIPENQQIISGIIDDFEKDKNEFGWKEFEMRFSTVHSDFYRKLSEINPNLTLNEKRLCAFLLLDMTTKEISSITGQTIRAIEQGRIRLRKQLGLTNLNVSLTSFLRNL
jgi:tetratricopeptide (TPR) repeat protein